MVAGLDMRWHGVVECVQGLLALGGEWTNENYAHVLNAGTRVYAEESGALGEVLLAA